jgi:hypothetical protein
MASKELLISIVSDLLTAPEPDFHEPTQHKYYEITISGWDV